MIDMVMKMHEYKIIFHQFGTDGYYKTWHTTGKNMLLYMHSDGGAIVTTEKYCPIKKGGLCFIGSNKFHYTLPDDPKEYHRSKVFLSGVDLDRILALFPEELGMKELFSPTALVCAQLTEAEQCLAEQTLMEIKQNIKDKHYSDAVLMNGFMRLLVYLTKGKNEMVAVASDDMQKAVEYINSHISENISMDDICSAVHMSKYHFCRKFKKTTGLTVMDYVLQTRIMAAKNMLSSDAFPVGEISGKCGFSSVSYFCRVFKESTGMTPLQYRRANT